MIFPPEKKEPLKATAMVQLPSTGKGPSSPSFSAPEEPAPRGFPHRFHPHGRNQYNGCCDKISRSGRVSGLQRGTKPWGLNSTLGRRLKTQPVGH